MAVGSSSAASTYPPPPPPNFTDKDLQDLHEKIDLLAQIAESRSMDSQKVLNIKSSLVDGINFLVKLSKEGQVADAASRLVSNHPLQPTTKSHVQSNALASEYLGVPMAAGSSSGVPTYRPPDRQKFIIEDLFCQIDFPAEYQSMDPGKALNMKSALVDGFDLPKKHLKERQVADAASSLVSSHPHQPIEPSVQLNAELRSSISEAETMEMRYLYVSNGHEIYLLDLLEYANEKPLSINAGGDHVPSLPIIATLDLIKEGRPVSVSLFKVGSEAYIIGGSEYNDKMQLHGYRGEETSKGTSRDSWLLSISGDKNDRSTLSLSLTKGGIKQMRRPKFSPIVEEIGGEIHVFDSTLWGSTPSSDWKFSHEVLFEKHHLRRYGRRVWKWKKIKISGGPVPDFVRYYVVVGPRIYALSRRNRLLFDSGNEDKKWEVIESSYEKKLQQAWDVLQPAGEARCVLELGDNGMYVIIVHSEFAYDYSHAVRAVAYLVNSSGKLVCMQPLDHFFGRDPMMQPRDEKSARIIKASDDQEGMMWCSLVTAKDMAIREECLFINFFTVKQHPSFDSSEYAFEMEPPPSRPPKAEFIRVDMKKRYVYKTEDRLHFSMQACFMSSRDLGLGAATNC